MSEVLHIDERIADLLLGEISESERESLEAHVAGCTRCNQELLLAADAFAALALALPAEAPPPALRDRILAAARPPRLAAMIDKLASLFDIGRAKARELLERIDEPASWLEGPVPNSQVMYSDVRGPKLGAALCAFVKMGAGVDWPAHRHLGREYMLVLQGGFKQHDGVEVHAGTVHVMEEGTSHRFTIFADEPCIAAVVINGGVTFEDPAISIADLLKR